MGPDAPPYADKILLSPHIYPASVIPRGCTSKGLCNRLSNSWGHLSIKVNCSSWRTPAAPVHLCTQQGDPHSQPVHAWRQTASHSLLSRPPLEFLVTFCNDAEIFVVKCAGLLQGRALPAVPGAGRRDRQPAAGLPQPLQ